MAIGREDQNEDEDLDVVVVEDQNVQDQNQAMEQDLDDQNLADEVQKAQAEENKVQTSILSFFKKKINFYPRTQIFSILAKMSGIARSGIARCYCTIFASFWTKSSAPCIRSACLL